ncbi:MAG: DUF1801 domain-containing protein [Holophagales bacterium]|nr:MAG: DUF1801 domain-containing protein [Holophagales bacterium]
MAELKTKAHDASVDAFLDGVADERRRADCGAVLALMREVTGEEPKMWGPSIVGFGRYHDRYASGHEAEACLTDFSPRKTALTLYVMPGFDRFDEILGRLGKVKAGKGCLYLKRLADVDESALRELIAASVAHLRAAWPTPRK